MKKKNLGLGDVTNGIRAKFQNWARYVLTKKWLTVINFMNKKKLYYFKYTIILDILSSVHVTGGWSICRFYGMF